MTQRKVSASVSVDKALLEDLEKMDGINRSDAFNVWLEGFLANGGKNPDGLKHRKEHLEQQIETWEVEQEQLEEKIESAKEEIEEIEAKLEEREQQTDPEVDSALESMVTTLKSKDNITEDSQPVQVLSRKAGMEPEMFLAKARERIEEAEA